MKQPPAGRRLRCRGDEELPLALPLGQEQAVEPDVVDEHAVRQVPARPLLAEGDRSLQVVPRDLDPRRDRLPGTDRELDRLAGHLADHAPVGAGEDLDGHLRCRGQADVAERAEVADNLPAGHRGRGPHRDLLVGRLVGSGGVCRRPEHAQRLPLPRLDLDRTVEREARRKPLDLDADRALETLAAVRREREFPAAARADLGIAAAERHIEGRLRGTNPQRVMKGRLGAETAAVAHPGHVLAVRRRHEHHLGVGAEPPHRLVVVFEVHAEQRQAVRRRPRSCRQRFDDPRRLAEGMGDGGGVEERVPVAGTGVDVEPGVGTARIKPEPRHLAVGIQVLVEFQLVLVVKAEVARLIRGLAAEREPRVAHGLQHHLLDRPAVGVEDLDPGIEP